MSQEQNYKDKIVFFYPEQDAKKTEELKAKITPLIQGYTINQITQCFKDIKERIERGYIINL